MAKESTGIKRKRDGFFAKMDKHGLALAYGNVRLKTMYTEVKPAEVILRTCFSRNICLNIPIVSSPMDTVTGADMAIAMAKLGGLGIIHRNMTPSEQASAVAKVKFYLTGRPIKKPICVNANSKVKDVLKTIEEKKYQFHSFPVRDDNEKLVGILTRNDFDFCINHDLAVNKIMSKELVTGKEGISAKAAFEIMSRSRKKILPILDSEGKLVGLYTLPDVKRVIMGNTDEYSLDKNGSLVVGAAIGVGEDAMRRMELLAPKGVDVVVIDTAHGDSKDVIETVKACKKAHPHIDVVAGNVSIGASALRLAKAGADAIKVGQGPGSICTTRVVAGVGRPQVTAIYDCEKKIRGSGIPIIADGGITYSGDIPIAIGAGASTVILGNLLAGTDEAPGEVLIKNGMPVKSYRGMGSLGAMETNKASRERYSQGDGSKEKLVPEGVEAVVPYKGPVSIIVYQLIGGLRSGMGYLGAKDIPDLERKADFDRIDSAGQRESHPHDIVITQKAPNYNETGRV